MREKRIHPGQQGATQNDLQKAVNTQTSPPRIRRKRAIFFLVVMAVVIVAFSVLAFLVRTEGFFPIDLKVTKFIQAMDYPIMTELMTGISWPGYTPQSFLLVLLTAGLVFVLGLRWEAIVVLVSAAFEELLNLLIKVLIHRPRPAADMVHVFQILGSYSFPSGHVMFYTCFFGFIWFIIYALLKHTWKRTLMLVIVGCPIVLVSISRVYLGEHWASDTVGAYLLGSLALVGVIQFYRWGKSRFFTKQPVARGRNDT